MWDFALLFFFFFKDRGNNRFLNQDMAVAANSCNQDWPPQRPGSSEDWYLLILLPIYFFYLLVGHMHPINCAQVSTELLKSLDDTGFTYSEVWSSQHKKGFLRKWNYCYGPDLLQLYQQHLFCAPPDGSSVRTICCSLWFDCWATCGLAQTCTHQGSGPWGGLSSHSRLWSLSWLGTHLLLYLQHKCRHLLRSKEHGVHVRFPATPTIWPFQHITPQRSFLAIQNNFWGWLYAVLRQSKLQPCVPKHREQPEKRLGGRRDGGQQGSQLQQPFYKTDKQHTNMFSEQLRSLNKTH